MVDIIIRDGCIVDGSGKPGFQADIAVQDGRIISIGNLADQTGRTELDASGLVVAPGFIDAHAHSDTTFLLDDTSAAKLYQGVTTEVVGQCGDSPFPALPSRMEAMKREWTDGENWYHTSFEEYFRHFQDSGKKMATNLALLVGHGCLRAGVLGYDDRPATPDELESMKAILRQDLHDGAWGMSLGLEYSPGLFSTPDELAALGSVVKECDGLIACHMRNEGLFINEAIEELLNVGRASGAHVHISHLKIDNYKAHGRAPEVWSLIENAKTEGVNVTADMYPYTASSTSLSIRCPQWTREGGEAAVAQALQGPRRAEIIDSLRSHYFNAERAETCLITDEKGYWPEIRGKTLRQVAEEYLHTTDYAEAAAEVLIRTHGETIGSFFVMSAEDMQYFLSQDICIGSDGFAYAADPAKIPSIPHPRSFGTFPEFFRLRREHEFCSLEQAVRRVTSKTADMLGMKDRGLLREGMVADITVFDPDMIAPRATHIDPVQLSTGVHHVIINGEIALKNGEQTDVRNGRILRKPISFTDHCRN